jgi:hypothetical protein
VLQGFSETGQISQPRSVNDNENVILGFGLNEANLCGAKINLGVSLNAIGRNQENHKHVLDRIEKTIQNDSFAIFESKCGKEFDILIFENVQPKDLLRAYIDAFWLAYQRNHPEKVSKNLKSKTNFDSFESQLSAAGWKTTHFQMNTLGWVGSLKKSV